MLTSPDPSVFREGSGYARLVRVRVELGLSTSLFPVGHARDQRLLARLVATSFIVLQIIHNRTLHAVQHSYIVLKRGRMYCF